MDFCLRMEGAAHNAATWNLSEEQARKILNQIREPSSDSAIHLKSFAEYSANWLRSKEVTIRDRGIRTIQGFCERFRRAHR
jgi:hypothetical protein